MFKSKIVFILGAGASNEIGLPLGTDLKHFIADKLDIRFPDGYKQESGSYKIMDAVSKHSMKIENIDNTFSTNVNDYLHQAWLIRDGMPQAISIDNYIDARRGNKMLELCGKLAVVGSSGKVAA